MKTLFNIRTDPETKKRAQKAAKALGVGPMNIGGAGRGSWGLIFEKKGSLAGDCGSLARYQFLRLTAVAVVFFIEVSRRPTA